jgi:DNA-directed RNA polymerase beta' subunit
MIKNGPKKYPGAKTITKTNEGVHKNISLKHVDVQTIADNLEIGDIVHRHLIDGDPCLFNRQPTLHKMSMMTHKIKILPHSTFRLNVTVCDPYAADFDGDEMNMHTPQSLQTAVEIEDICLVKQHIISPGTSLPSIGIVQDTLIGSYLLTINDIKLKKYQMNNLMMFSNKYNAYLPEPAYIENNIPYWSGKQLFSMILPDVSILGKFVKIIRGEIKDGFLNKDSLGKGSSGLIKQIYNQYGTEQCNDFLNNTQKLITRWLIDHSFTISFGDCIVKKNHRSVIKEIINKYLGDTFDIIQKAQHGVFANELDDIYKKENLENEIRNILSKLSEKVKEYIFEHIPHSNNFYQIGDKGSGAKGNSINILQMMGLVGQQDIWGFRIDEGFTERTLPHFLRNDKGPDAKGFCRNSYVEGLTPSETFFHAMSGRVGVIDKAIKSVTGDTPVIIIENGISKQINIGDWIDNLLYNNKSKVQNLPEKEMELLELDYEAFIPTTNLDGIVSWGLIKNVTRHDPGKELYEIKTKSGRKVIVTESHSLLIWNGEKFQFERKSSSNVIIGDLVPVTVELKEPPKIINNIYVKNQVFNLNEENGLFLAIFIQYGTLDSQYDLIQINCSNEKIISYCKTWFKNKNIIYDISKNSITGNSEEMVIILNEIIEIRSKYLNANNLFIKGFLKGFFVINNLDITSNGISINVKSTSLINDLSNFLSRLNIFSCINDNNITIPTKWIKEFKNKINLILDDNANTKLLIDENSINISYSQVSNTILDPIIEINKVDISIYPKVYDLTIPSTLNFGLANGLHVVDTADSGYLSRKFIKAAEDLMVNYDMTVRNATKHIIQFTYGDDNLDPIKLERISRIELIEYDNKKMQDIYKFESLDDKDYFENFMTPDAVKEMMSDPEYKNLLNEEYIQILSFRDKLRYDYFSNIEVIGDINTYIPVNLFRIIPSQRYKFNIEDYTLSDLTPQYIINTYNNLLKDIVKYLPEKENNWKLFKIIFKSYLSTKRVIKEFRMTKPVFDSIILMIKEKMYDSFIAPGELVGIVGAQTLGESSTQLTMKTVHAAGVGSGAAVVTEAVPRLKEILHVSKNLKNKNMCIYLKDEYAKSKENAKKIQARFGYTQLKDLLIMTEILYDDGEGKLDKNEDIEFIKSYKEFSELFDSDKIDETTLSPWILRLIFDKEALMNKKITVQEIQETIKENFHNDQDIDCIYSDDSVNDVVMRIQIRQDSKGSFFEFIKDFEKQLIELSLRGISDIKLVEIGETNIIRYREDGSLEQCKEWMLNTNGSNLLDILAEDCVDIRRTITNDILEFYEIFGIEATRQLIYKELNTVYSGKEINPRHIQIMADIMTYRGNKIMQIDRHGLNKNPEIGPIAKASFEEVMNIFKKAAVFAEKDNMKGVSANIMMGQFCNSGTNSFEVLIDEDKLNNNMDEQEINEFVDFNEKDVEKAFTNAFEKVNNKIENIDDSNFEFGFGIEQEKQFVLEDVKGSELKLINNNNEVKENIHMDFDKITVEDELNYKASNEDNLILNFEKMDVEEPEYKEDINYNKINLEEPIYEEEVKEEKPAKKLKKVKEEKPKKPKKASKKEINENEK